MERIYSPLQIYSDEEIEAMVNSNLMEAIIILPLSVGMNHRDWKKAQDICAKLSNHPDERVRANSALGLAYIARTKGKLEKHIVKPIIHKLLNDCDEYKWRIIDSIEDINIFMNWKLAEKALERLE